MLKLSRKASKSLCLLFLLLSIIGVVAIWFIFPRHREGQSLIQYIVQIFVFMLGITGISLAPAKFKFHYLLLAIPLVVYLSYFAPRMTFLALKDDLGMFYTLEFTFLYPGLVAAVCMAYRLGGGTAGNCFRTGLTGIILLFSGFLDLMWFVVNQVDYDKTVGRIPHIEALIGHTPSFSGLIAFLSVHVVIMVIINLLPFDKWVMVEESC